MKQIPNELTKNFKDPAVRCLLMKEYSDCRGFQGTNEDGEEVFVSINPDSIVVTTFQKNGWMRDNYYNAEGYPDGEAYTGKWNKPEDPAEVVYLLILNWMDEGRFEVIPYKHSESAIGAYQMYLKLMKNDNPVELGKDKHFNCFGILDCMIQKKVICDA